MEELLGVMLRTLLGAILWLVVDLLFYRVFYSIGWLLCRLCSGGRWPGADVPLLPTLSNPAPVNRKDYTRSLIALIGVLFTILCLIGPSLARA